MHIPRPCRRPARSEALGAAGGPSVCVFKSAEWLQRVLGLDGCCVKAQPSAWYTVGAYKLHLLLGEGEKRTSLPSSPPPAKRRVEQRDGTHTPKLGSPPVVGHPDSGLPDLPSGPQTLLKNVSGLRAGNLP